MFIELRNFSYSPRGSISAPGADIMPKWYYIHAPSADINELGAMTLKVKNIKGTDNYGNKKHTRRNN